MWRFEIKSRFATCLNYLTGHLLVSVSTNGAVSVRWAARPHEAHSKIAASRFTSHAVSSAASTASDPAISSTSGPSSPDCRSIPRNAIECG